MLMRKAGMMLGFVLLVNDGGNQFAGAAVFER